MSAYRCPQCERQAAFERQSIAVFEGEVPVGNALVLTCSECEALHEVLSAPTDR
jgi:hypothetical protein